MRASSVSAFAPGTIAAGATASEGWLGALDDFRNWLIREAA
jgi:hypothetical protein